MRAQSRKGSGCVVLQLLCPDGGWTLSKALKILEHESRIVNFDIRQDGRTFVARVSPYQIWEIRRPIFIIEFEVGARRIASGPCHRVAATTAPCSNVGLCARVTLQRMSWDAAERWPKP